MRKRNNIKLNCQICGKFFWVIPCRKYTAKYCSNKCNLIAMHRNNDKRIFITCLNCGKIKKIYPAYLKAGQKHCSKSCSKMGKNNPVWNNGSSFEPYGLDFNRQLKYKIKERDNFECQVCHIKENGASHHVHHIDYDKKNNYEKNLKILCIYCHSKTNINRLYWKDLLMEITT